MTNTKTASKRTQPSRTTQIMTPEHPDWDDFYDGLLDAFEGRSERQQESGPDIKCPIARRILKQMGFSDVGCEASVEYFRSRGGFSDLEVLLNVEQ